MSRVTRSIYGLLVSAWGTWAAAQPAPDAGGAPPKQSVLRAPGEASTRLQSLTGSWTNDHVVVGLTQVGIVPLEPSYEARLKVLQQLAVEGKEVVSNESKCVPSGPPMDMAFGFQAFANAEELAVLMSGPVIRHIWVDGRPHTPDRLLFGSFEGESIGRWEKDTLVVDTIGLQASDEVILGISVGDDAMHLVERWRLIAPGHLQIDTTVEDATALSHSWTFTRQYSRVKAGGEVQYCTPAIDRARDGGFDLTPPAGGYVPPGAQP